MAFAQELKDFVSSFQAGYNMVKSPEEKEAEKARTRYTNVAADSAEFDLQQSKELAPLKRQALEVDIGNTKSLMGQRQFTMQQERELAPLKRQALEVETEARRLEIDTAKERKTLLNNIINRKTGARAAPPASTPTEAVPTEGPQSLIQGGSGNDTLLGSAHEAVKSGLLHNVQLFQLGGESGVPADDENSQRMQLAYLSGDGAEDPEIMAAAQGIIKEQAGKENLTPAELNLYTLAATYELYLAEGEPEKAQKVAGAIMQSYRMKSAQWAAVAKAASSKGDIDNTTTAIAKAYSFIPDGYDVSFTKDEDTGKIWVKRKDIESGKVVSSELKHPREIFALAMEVDPGVFDEALMTAAGQREAAKEPINASDIEHIQGAAAGAVEEVFAGVMPEGAEVPPELSSRLMSATSGIIQANLSKGQYVPPADAARAAWEITVVDPQAPDTMQFGVVEADGGVVANFVDGTQVFIPKAQFQQLMVMRQENAAQAQKELDETAAREKSASERDARAMEGFRRARGALTGVDRSEALFDGTP